MSRKNNKLHTRDLIRLVDWLRVNRSTIESKKLQPSEVARWASAKLDLHITCNNVKGVMGPKDGAPIPFAWPRTQGARDDRSLGARYRVFFEMLEELRQAVGFEPEGELSTLWYKLGEELGVELPTRL